MWEFFNIPGYLGLSEAKSCSLPTQPKPSLSESIGYFPYMDFTPKTTLQIFYSPVWQYFILDLLKQSNRFLRAINQYGYYYCPQGNCCNQKNGKRAKRAALANYSRLQAHFKYCSGSQDTLKYQTKEVDHSPDFKITYDFEKSRYVCGKCYKCKQKIGNYESCSMYSFRLILFN